MSLSLTISEIDGDFGRKLENFPTHRRIFCTPADGVPLGIGCRRWGRKKPKWWRYQMVKIVKIRSAV